MTSDSHTQNPHKSANWSGFSSRYIDVVFTPQFYTEVTEVETWIREKLPRVSSDDYGRDETSAQSLLRKHETLELELDSYRAKVSDLRNTCQALVTAENFDADKIQRRQVMISDFFCVSFEICQHPGANAGDSSVSKKTVFAVSVSIPPKETHSSSLTSTKTAANRDCHGNQTLPVDVIIMFFRTQKLHLK